MQSTVIKPWNTIQQAIRFQRFDLFGTLKLFSAFNWALAIVITLSASPLWAQVADIRTVLGAAGFYGGYEDGIGTAARFNSPTSIAFNNVGSAPSLMYVADTGNHRIRVVVLATLQVGTLAGAGVAGWADGVGTAARFNSPTDLAVDNSNTYLYVTDKENGAIRKINLATNAVTTIIGKSCTSTSSDCNGQSGCCTNNLITGGTSPTAYPISYSPGSGIYASFSIPYKMKLSYSAPASSSAGALWVTDQLGTLSVVDLSSSPATMYMAACIDPSGGGCAGCTSTGGCADYSNQTLTGVELDPNILVSVSNDQSIWQCIPGGTFSTLASCSRAIGTGDFWSSVDTGAKFGYWWDEMIGDPLSARLSNPDGLFFDAASSSLYVADTGNHAIRQVNYVSGAPANVVTIAGQGSTAQNNSDPDTYGDYLGAGQRLFSPPTCGLTDPLGEKCGDPGGAGSADGTTAFFNNPRGVGFVDATNQLWVVDTNNHTIRVSVGTANAIRSTLSPGSASIIANGSSTKVLTVQAKDSYGNNLSTGGATVTITRSSGTGTIGAVTDNNNGTYTATVISPVATGSGVFVATIGGSAVKSGSGSQTQATVTYAAGAANATQSTLTPSTASITANGSSTQVLTVQAKDASGNNLSTGVATVTITKSSGIGTISAVTNNSDGTYTATVTSSSSSGSGVFVATLGGSAVKSGSASQTQATVTYAAGAADAIQSTLTPSTASITANGSSTQVLTVQDKDASGNNLSTGVATVTITKSSGTGTIGAVTNNNDGTYTATVTSSSSSGSGVFVATLGGSAVKSGSASQTQATVTYAAGAADAIQSTLTPSTASITANGSSTQVLTVQAKDASGNNLSTGGATVTITKLSGTGTISAVTNNNDGTYTATVTSPVATGSGVFVATLNSAAVKSNSGTQTQATLSYVVDTASISTSSISASPASITADGSSTSTITVQLKDANGNNLSSSGGTVSLSSTAGTLSSVTNNNNGTYSATLTSATTAGSATITGQLAASALSSTASVTFIAGSANQLVFTSIPQTIAVSAVSGTMNVQLQDNHGNPVYAGVNALTVNLSSNTTGTATFYQTDGITPISNITIASIGNTASFKYKDTQIGTPTINVSANGLSSATQQVTVSIGAADAAQSTLTPSTASITANGSSTQVLTVQAKDASGNNLSTGGESITITKLTGTGTISAVNDNSNGTYTATVTSASNAGSGVFVATLGGTVVKSGSSNQTQSIVNYFAAVITPPAPPPSISAGSTTTISNLGSYAPVISGGTLILNKDDNTSTSLTVASAGGTIKNPNIGSATLSGALTGTGGLTFTGAGTTVLTGANTYTGGTTVASGTLQGNTNSLQGNVTNNGTVVFDQANTGNFSGTITGTGKLVIQNTGTLILTGNNNYSGGTTVNSGSSLSISSGSSLGTGTLDLLGSSTLFTTGDTFITIDIAVSGH